MLALNTSTSGSGRVYTISETAIKFLEVIYELSEVRGPCHGESHR
jgi:hypothetical protein